MARTPSRLLARTLAAALTSALVIAFNPVMAHADSVGPIDFESYALGAVWGQDGWTGGYCGPHDIEIVDNSGYAGAPASFGGQSYRISNAYVNGCFGDSFTTSLADEAGESTAANGGFSGGTRQQTFTAELNFASTTGALQPGLAVQVSPDRGDGARMSYVRMKHTPSGLELEFIDVEGVTGTPPCFQCANFVTTSLGTYDETAKHALKIEERFCEGPSNDLVQVFVDGALVHTGTSWEDYYYYDTESSPTPPRVSRTVDSLLIRSSGSATPAVLGQGFLMDGISLTSGPAQPCLTTKIHAAPIVLQPSPLKLTILVGLSARLTSGGEALPDKKVVFNTGSKRLCSDTTDEKGIAQCGALLSVDQVRALIHLGYNATFPGDDTYFGSSDHAGLLA